MSSSSFSHAVTDGPTVETTNALRSLYFLRAAFSITWATLITFFVGKSVGLGTALFIIYPVWDVLGTLLDIRANQNSLSKTPQYLNAGISVITALAVGIALRTGVPEALIVFGIWAIITGLIQLILGLRRRKSLSGQWPMIISGGQSVIAGGSFIILAHDPTMGIASLAGYAAFGAFYYLLSAFRLSKIRKATATS